MHNVVNPIFVTIGDWRVIVDFQPECDGEPNTGIVYFSDGSVVREYVMDLGEADNYSLTGAITVQPERSDYANLMEVRDNVYTSDQDQLNAPKDDILAVLDSMIKFFQKN